MKRPNRKERSQSFSSLDSGHSTSKRYRGLGTESLSGDPPSTNRTVTSASRSARNSKLSSNFRPFASIGGPRATDSCPSQPLAGGGGSISESEEDDEKSKSRDSEAEPEPPKDAPEATKSKSAESKEKKEEGGEDTLGKIPNFQNSSQNKGKLQEKVNEVVRKEECKKQASFRKEDLFGLKIEEGEEKKDPKAGDKRSDPFGDIEAEKLRLKKIKDLKNGIKFPKFRKATDFQLENVDNHVKAIITFDDDLGDFRRSFRNSREKYGGPESGKKKSEKPGPGGKDKKAGKTEEPAEKGQDKKSEQKTAKKKKKLDEAKSEAGKGAQGAADKLEADVKKKLGSKGKSGSDEGAKKPNEKKKGPDDEGPGAAGGAGGPSDAAGSGGADGPASQGKDDEGGKDEGAPPGGAEGSEGEADKEVLMGQGAVEVKSEKGEIEIQKAVQEGGDEKFATPNESVKTDGPEHKSNIADKPEIGDNEENKNTDYWEAIKGTKI